MRGFDLRIKLHVSPEIELLGDELCIAQSLGLRGEVFCPVPFIQEFLGEGEVICVAFGVEPACEESTIDR